MNRTLYLGVFLVSAVLIALGLLFLCAAVSLPERMPLALILLFIGAIGAAWSGLSYRRWRNLQPDELASQITALAAKNKGELAVTEVMSAFAAPADAVNSALGMLLDKGQAHREHRADRIVYVFPGLKEHRVVRRCMYCGSTFPVKEPLHKCPNCGGELELVQT
ncbi:MAG: hypothetical protein ACM3JD_13735 [Rudaea sp.]